MTQATNYWQSHSLTPDRFNVETFTYVYLGSGKVAVLDGGTSTVADFEDTIALCLRSSFLTVFRPGQKGKALDISVGSVRLRDQNGIPCTTAPAASAEADVSNYGSPVTLTLAVAAYDADGRMLRIQSKSVTLERGLNTVGNFDMTGLTDIASLKAFVLSSLDAFQPLGRTP